MALYPCGVVYNRWFISLWPWNENKKNGSVMLRQVLMMHEDGCDRLCTSSEHNAIFATTSEHKEYGHFRDFIFISFGDGHTNIPIFDTCLISKRLNGTYEISFVNIIRNKPAACVSLTELLSHVYSLRDVACHCNSYCSDTYAHTSTQLSKHRDGHNAIEDNSG